MRSTVLNMLIVKVNSQAINATNKTEANDFDLLQTALRTRSIRVSQLPSTPAIDSNANARLADSKIINTRSSRTSRNFAAGGLNPRGMERNSSYAIIRINGM